MKVSEIMDIYVRIECDLLVVGDSIITDRHHASNGNYEDDDPQNQIGGIIPAYPLSGWLRHGMEAVVQDHGATACHPGEASASFKKDDVYDRDLDAGYHEKGACLEGDDDTGCVILDLFGGFENRAGKLLRSPLKFSPVRSSVNYERGEAEAHYRRINRNIVSRNPEDGRESLRNTEMDAVGNVDGAWHLRFRESKPEFLGLLAEAVEYLNAHNTHFMHQIGGSRNFGAGVAYCELINPLYTERELKRVFDRGKGKTNAMEEKDEEWENNHRHEIETALEARIKSDHE
jgi:hypothetical protein